MVFLKPIIYHAARNEGIIARDQKVSTEAYVIMALYCRRGPTGGALQEGLWYFTTGGVLQEGLCYIRGQPLIIMGGALSGFSWTNFFRKASDQNNSVNL